jgi:uncharacterized spore protein YtfJ
MAATKPTPPTKITTVVHTLLDGLHSMSKSETIIGDPYTLGEATIVPVHRLRVALGAGAVHGGAKQDATSGESGGLGAGGAVQIEPVAVIAVGRDGVPRIMCVETENDAAERLMKQLPDLLTSTTKVISERIAPLVSKFLNRAATPKEKEALAPEQAPALLASKADDGR